MRAKSSGVSQKLSVTSGAARDLSTTHLMKQKKWTTLSPPPPPPAPTLPPTPAPAPSPPQTAPPPAPAWEVPHRQTNPMPQQAQLARYLDDLHFGQYFTFACSFLNKTHPFRQACICTYGILSERSTFCTSYMLFGIIRPSGSRLPMTANITSKVERKPRYARERVVVPPLTFRNTPS